MKTPIFATVLFALCLPAMAQSSPEKIQPRTPPKDSKKLTPQEREKLLGITPEARQAKLLEREQYIEKRRGELEKKKAAGTLTSQEAKMLREIEQRKPSPERSKATPAKDGAAPKRAPD